VGGRGDIRRFDGASGCQLIGVCDIVVGVVGGVEAAVDGGGGGVGAECGFGFFGEEEEAFFGFFGGGGGGGYEALGLGVLGFLDGISGPWGGGGGWWEAAAGEETGFGFFIGFGGVVLMDGIGFGG